MSHRKRVKHFDDPSHARELTFSCYRRRPLLEDDEHRRLFVEALGRACTSHSYGLAAFVLMPEHVHLLLWPKRNDCRISPFLSAAKRPCSFRIKQRLAELQSPLLGELTIRERPGKSTFRFWQEGPGYDRNLETERAVVAAIDYVHMNPVRRGLVESPLDWKWSSARWHATNGEDVDPDLPTIEPIPKDFFPDPSP